MGLHRRHEDRSKRAIRPLPKHIPMPSYGSSKQNIVYRLPIAVLMIMAFLLLTLLTRNSGIQATHHNLLHRRHPQQIQLEPRVVEEHEPEPQKLDQPEPQPEEPKIQQQLPLVCSHQILNPPPFLPPKDSQAHVSPLDGSLDGMTALFQNGVRCFDIDVVTLLDGTLLASHPRRLQQAIREAIASNEQPNTPPENNPPDPEIVITDYTMESLSQILRLDQYNNLDQGKNSIRGSTIETNNSASSPFPTFDQQILPHFAKLVHGIPGAFSNEASSSAAFPWGLKGPLLNIDLKQGPNLTTEKVLELAQQIHDLQLEDHVAVCVMDNDGTQDVDLLNILHEHNTQLKEQSKPIPLTLVLRDLVPKDANVDNIRNLVQNLYPQSIKALVPSFKFPLEWFRNIRTPQEESIEDTTTTTNELWKLPMTVWTIDSKADYDFVASLTTTTTTSMETIPMASAVVANSPMELLPAQEITRMETT